MSLVVCKFGGTSLADAGKFQIVKNIIDSEPKRKIIVVSAPGKRHPDDPKITDLLYLCYELAVKGLRISEPFDVVKKRFFSIEAELKIEANMEYHLNEIQKKIEKKASRDFVASRGEYLSAILMSRFLGTELVSPEKLITISTNGSVEKGCYSRLGEIISNPVKSFVIPGFYGCDADGQIKTFSRGGSDITGAIAARAARADVYENWTDVSGLLMADPRICKDPKPLDEVSYREVRELSYMGASVFHDEAIKPVMEAGIPIHIKNTLNPEHPGTKIVPALPALTLYDIAGIAGKKNFCLFSLEKYMMNKEIGFIRKILGIFENKGVSIEHCPTSIDSLSVLVSGEEIKNQGPDIMEEIKQVVQPDKIEMEEGLGLIAVVGEGMARQVGMAGRVFSALGKKGINVRIIDQGASEFNIIIGVSNEEFNPAIQCLYEELMKPNPQFLKLHKGKETNTSIRC